MQYQPEAPFDAGTPERAPREIVEAAKNSVRDLTAAILQAAKTIAAQHGVWA